VGQGTAPRTAEGTGGRPDEVAEVAERLGSAREARWILDHAGDSWPELVERRLAGEPLQYVLGTWPFRGLELQVDRRVLIPRPETEQVAEVALRELARLGAHGAHGALGALGGHGAHGGRNTGCTGGRVCADLGTGSGAIALSLAIEGPALCGALEVWATDISADALAVATGNLAALRDDEARARVHLAQGSWFDALPRSLVGCVDLLVSNPPYVPEPAIASLDPVVRDWEPHEALAAPSGAGGVAGMAHIETIVSTAPLWLASDGVAVVELDPAQAGPAADLARAAGFGRVSVHPDLSGLDRMLVAGR
jgi:release factor glutamine methyltransferase